MAVPAEIRRNTTLVVVAAVLYLLLQGALAGFARPMDTFEIALFQYVATEDLWVLRLGMMVVSSLGLLLAFRTWVRPGGKAAWAAAGFFAVSWAPLYYGGVVRPEMPAALACVAAAGSTTRWLVERDRGALVGAAFAVAMTVVLMPVIGVALAVALAVVVAVWARAAGGLALVALGTGLAVGRALAGVLRASELGGRVADVEATLLPGTSVRQLHALLDPLLIDGVLPPSTVWRAAAGGVVVLGLVVLAVVWWRWPHRRNAARTGVVIFIGLLIAGAFVPHGAPSAFLPAYGLLSIPVGAGLLAAWRAARDTGSFPATLAYVAVSLTFVGWQATITAIAGA